MRRGAATCVARAHAGSGIGARVARVTARACITGGDTRVRLGGGRFVVIVVVGLIAVADDVGVGADRVAAVAVVALAQFA